MQIKSYLKFFSERFARAVLGGIAFFVPVKRNRVLFYSFTGHQYTCSPKYISEYIGSHYGDKVEIIWAFRDIKSQALVPEYVKCVRYQSFSFFYYHMSSKIIVSNIYPFHLINKKKNQIMIDTWHGGGAYKVAGNDYDSGTPKIIRDDTVNFNKKNISTFVSSSRLFTDYFVHGGMCFDGKVINAGLPRNDIFFFDERRQDQIREKVYKMLGLNEGINLILYAPTWRSEDETSNFEFDAHALEAAAAERFGGEWRTLVRMHMYTRTHISGDVVDAQSYPDMQELLLACGILISDYSSSIWDYSMTGKPCFLYAYDVNKYEGKRAFYVDINEWGFPLCPTMGSLVDAIKNFDEQDFKAKMQYHHQLLGGYDDGHACEKVSDYIIEILGESI